MVVEVLGRGSGEGVHYEGAEEEEPHDHVRHAEIHEVVQEAPQPRGLHAQPPGTSLSRGLTATCGDHVVNRRQTGGWCCICGFMHSGQCEARCGSNAAAIATLTSLLSPSCVRSCFAPLPLQAQLARSGS